MADVSTTACGRFEVERGDPLPLLRRRFRLLPAARESVRLTFLDTFDWRVWRDGGRLLLEESRRGPRLAWIRRGERVTLPVTAPVRFVADLPHGAVRDQLAAIVEVRALSPVGRMRVVCRPYRVVDAEGKTTVHLCLDRRTLEDRRGAATAPAVVTVTAEPLKGYASAHRTVTSFLSTLEGLTPVEDDDLARAAGAWDRRPGDYSPRFELDLDPRQPAAEAVRRILLALLGAIRANVEGAVEDVDIEFLHDLRVATRRTRSALSQLGDLLPTREVVPFVEAFRWLGGITGACRDLDVYQLQVEELHHRLGADEAAALAPFLAHLAVVRGAAHRELVAALTGRRFRSLIRRWERTLGRHHPAQRRSPPVRVVADEKIRRAYARLLRRGVAAGEQPTAEVLHRLRIEAKKLRYLLEFFASLYPPRRIGSLVGRLKSVQDALGGFQDTVVQQRKLLSFAGEMSEAGAARPETLVAMGRLAAMMQERGDEHRRDFARVFAAFASPATKAKMRALVSRRKEDAR